MRHPVPLLALLAFGAASCGLETYACHDSEQCNEGTCQPSGYCSFPDPECDSGQRYGEFAAADLRGRCVQADVATSSTSDDSTTIATSLHESTSSTAAPEGSTSSSDGDASTAVGEGTSTSTSSVAETTGATASTGSTEIDPDLIAWWPLDGEPADGIEDATPHGLHGTCDACPASVPAIFDSGLGFMGAEVVTVPDSPLFVSETFTVAAWVRVGGLDTPTSYHHIVTKPVGVGNRNSWEMIVANGTSVLIEFVVANPLESAIAAVDLPALDTWMHVAGTFDGTDVRLYLDGELQSTAGAPAGGVAWDDNPVLIGGDIDNEVLRTTFIGDVDDVRVYGRALDEAEVAALAAPP